MPLPKITVARELSNEALADEILKVKKDLFTLRLRLATRQTVQPHEFIHAKHQLAQLMTVERERELQVPEEVQEGEEDHGN